MIPSKTDIVSRSIRTLSLATGLLALAAASRGADESPPEIIPTSMLTASDDLEVTVWAHTPMLNNPTNMDIDHAGRIWVTEGVNYRHHAGRSPGGDRIVVIEDKDGDGQADDSWTFVQDIELVAPLGIAVIDNKIYVSNAPDLIVYTDVDRDLRWDPRIDKRDVLLTGFNGHNHDHALHSVTFGPDGLLYLSQGNAGAYFTDRSDRTFRVGSAYDGVFQSEPIYGFYPKEYAGAPSDDGHVYVGGFTMRLQPDGTNVEIIGFNYRNSYEQAITSFGDVFQNDNDDPPACRTTFLIEYGNAGFFSRDGSRTWNADKRPGQDTATAEWRQQDPGVIPAGDVYGGGSPTGIAYYEGDALGEEWRGTLLSCEAARNTVFGYRPTDKGAGKTLDRFNFLTSNQEGKMAGVDTNREPSSDLKTLFRPSDVAVGPDGAVYVTDWFDPRVGGHQDLDETISGTIYRIAPKGFKTQVPSLDLTTQKGQIEALRSPAVNVRALGFTRLREQGSEAVGVVAELLDDGNPYVAGRAAWLLAQLGPEGVKKTEALLNDENASMRSAAFQALRRVKSDMTPYASKLASDSSPAVRREVAIAMRDVPFAKSKDILLELADGYDGEDRSYLEAWGIGATNKEEKLYEALKKNHSFEEASQQPRSYARLVWRLTPPAAADDFAARGLSTALPMKDRVEAVTALGFIPTEGAADALLKIAQDGEGLAKEHAFWWLQNYRNIRWKEFGIDKELKERGIYDPEKIIVTESTVPAPDPEKAIPYEEVAALEGNAHDGAAKFTACYMCHQLGDTGPTYGPDLTGWAQRQTTDVVIRSIVDPSESIAHGYRGNVVQLKNGTVVQGIIDSYGDPIVVRSTGGVSQMIPEDRVEAVKNFGRSLMLSADQLGLRAQDVADIVAYLKEN